MECISHEKLEYLEGVVKTNFSCLNVSYEVCIDNHPYLCIFKQPISGYCLLPFLPMFYLIGTVDEESELSLKIITHHGKILKQINQCGKSNLADAKIIDFVSNLLYLKPCQGVNVLDYALKIDPYTFTFLYLVEQMGDKTVVRSRQCLFVNNNNRTNCDMCSHLDLQYITKNGKKIDLADTKSVMMCLNNTELSSSCDILIHEETDINLCTTNLMNPSREYKHMQDTVTTESETITNRNKAIKITKTLYKTIEPTIGIRTLNCDQCSFRTTNKRNLKRHTKYNHQNKPHSCHLCSYATASRYTLLYHMESVHSKSKEFKCELPG